MNKKTEDRLLDIMTDEHKKLTEALNEISKDVQFIKQNTPSRWEGWVNNFMKIAAIACVLGLISFFGYVNKKTGGATTDGAALLKDTIGIIAPKK